jgi:hypothetical protein
VRGALDLYRRWQFWVLRDDVTLLGNVAYTGESRVKTSRLGTHGTELNPPRRTGPPPAPHAPLGVAVRKLSLSAERRIGTTSSSQGGDGDAG